MIDITLRTDSCITKLHSNSSNLGHGDQIIACIIAARLGMFAPGLHDGGLILLPQPLQMDHQLLDIGLRTQHELTPPSFADTYAFAPHSTGCMITKQQIRCSSKSAGQQHYGTEMRMWWCTNITFMSVVMIRWGYVVPSTTPACCRVASGAVQGACRYLVGSFVSSGTHSRVKAPFGSCLTAHSQYAPKHTRPHWCDWWTTRVNWRC